MTEVDTKAAAPILVTGAERTGTSWVGHMLTAGNEATYISETFSFFDARAWMLPPLQYWHIYICEENEEEYLEAIDRVLNFRYPTWRALRSIKSKKDLRRSLQNWKMFSDGRIYKKRPLMKDPSGIFSAPWLAQRFGFQVVITIRNPLAFVSSRKRLKWPIRLNDWLEQPLLVKNILAPYHDEIERVVYDVEREKADLVDQAIVYWRVIYQVVAEYKKKYPQFIFTRHEDLSLNPVDEYRSIYTRLGLGFNEHAEKKNIASTNKDNPKELTKGQPFSVSLDSKKNLENWKHRLTEDEILRIRKATEDVATLYYPTQEQNT